MDVHIMQSTTITTWLGYVCTQSILFDLPYINFWFATLVIDFNVAFIDSSALLNHSYTSPRNTQFFNITVSP